MVKLSILDQSPISTGQTAQEALQASVRLAQLGEDLGYERFWIAEHHDLFGLACPNPDVMLGDRKSTRLNSSHVAISYAVFCLKKKKEGLVERSTGDQCWQ